MALELRAVDPDWDLSELHRRLAAMSTDERAATLRRAGIQPPPRRVLSPPAATRREAMATVAGGAAAAVLPIELVPTPDPPDVLHGLALDFQRATPGLSYAPARRLAEFA